MYFRELNKQYGKIVRVRLGPNQTVMLFDPELISQTIANEGAYPVRRSVPIMETYVKRTKRNMLSVQYVHSIHTLLPYNRLLPRQSNFWWVFLRSPKRREMPT